MSKTFDESKQKWKGTNDQKQKSKEFGIEDHYFPKYKTNKIKTLQEAEQAAQNYSEATFV